MRPNLIPLLTAILLSPSVSNGAWQRIVMVNDPRIAITLLLKSEASPADEEFVGLEFDNKSGSPIRADALNYRLEEVRLTPLWQGVAMQ